MKAVSNCPICGSIETRGFFELNDMPANIGVLWQSRTSAMNCSRGKINLIFCRSCGIIWNRNFDGSILEYSEAYDNSLHFSAVYQEYALSQARHIIDRYNIKGKTVIEVGCGKGDFLMMLCDIGKNKGVGFDVSYESREIDDELAGRITFVKDFYTEKYRYYQGSLICSRYVLEHIEQPVEFLSSIYRSIGERSDTMVYFEVPNVYLIIEKMSIWDIIYEHCLYFSPGSLANLFETCGFLVQDVSETYENQFVTIEATLPDSNQEIINYDRSRDFNKAARLVDRFSKTSKERLESWQNKIQQYYGKNQKMIVWGAGAKGVGFLNLLKISDVIPYIVDINPNKHGKFVAGTGQKIVPPNFVKEYNPDVVIIMNPVYKDEIKQNINQMGCDVEVMTV